MSPETIIAQLEQINSWRRGEESEPQPAPKHVGKVIDAAAASLRSLIASNTTLRDQRDATRAELKLRKEDISRQWAVNTELKTDLARMEEYLRNSGRNMDEAQEQIAERDARVADLSADLARVTAERQNWKEWAEDARAMFHKQIDAAAIMATRAEQAELRNAELVAALREIIEWVDEDGADEKYDREIQRLCATALARAESATPAKHPDTKRLDWLCSDTEAANYFLTESIHAHSPDCLRDALDAARKQGGSEG